MHHAPAQSKREHPCGPWSGCAEWAGGHGCIVDTRWNIHEKIVIIDDEILWFGSLNPLSHTNRTDEMMARVTGKPAALQLSAFMAVTSSLSAEKAEGLSVIGENPRLPECSRRTTYRLGSYGPFWQCEEGCGWKQNVVGRTVPGRQQQERVSLPKTGSPCPICTGPTVLRHGPHGHFYGCSKYPACKGIVKDAARATGTTKTGQKPAGGADGGSRAVHLLILCSRTEWLVVALPTNCAYPRSSMPWWRWAIAFRQRLLRTQPRGPPGGSAIPVWSQGEQAWLPASSRSSSITFSPPSRQDRRNRRFRPALLRLDRR